MTAADGRLDVDSSVEVGGVAMIKAAGSDWESGSFSSGQSPLNGIVLTCIWNVFNFSIPVFFIFCLMMIIIVAI